MTADRPSRSASRVPGERTTGDRPDRASSTGGPSRNGGPSRGFPTIAYTVVTAIGGVSALTFLGFSVAQGAPTVVDVLLWGALAVLLLGSAVHQWWFAGRAADRSRHIHAEITADEVDAFARESTGNVDLVRRLRVAYPGLSLRDGYELMQAHRQRTADDDA
ncbi:MAG TPA: hypothetical protein H9755_12805 [Candidatus Dietzia intestinigallinarum]|nr:hypothetical protein [Candidatus Dietzia intestinigallinarum]